MSEALIISQSYVDGSEGSPEEQVTSGELVICANNRILTRLYNGLLEKESDGPIFPGIHLAEWLLSNWWRLHHEPFRNRIDWYWAHSMTEIGEGYVWPRIIIRSVGNRVIIKSIQSTPTPTAPLRYLGAGAVELLDLTDLSDASLLFSNSIKNRLDDSGLQGTTLHALLHDIEDERANPSLAALRKLEAMLGVNPDALPEKDLYRALGRSEMFGGEAIDEVAAACGDREEIDLNQVLDLIECGGTSKEWNVNDAIEVTFERHSDVPHRVGISLAHHVRNIFGNRTEPLENSILADALGISTNLLENGADIPVYFDYALHGSNSGRMALKSRYETGRRFAASRLLSDHILFRDNLLPATRSLTWRQKVQKAFSAELLAPIDALREYITGDPNDREEQQSAADYFNVSIDTVEASLANRGIIPRPIRGNEDDDNELGVADLAAA